FFAAGLATHNCFRKKGGCGAKFQTGDAAIESQQTGRVPNAEIADQVNTIQKMGQKRSLIAATLLAVNASEFFTQDVEDFVNTTAASSISSTPPPQAPSASNAYDEPLPPTPVRASVVAGGRTFSPDSGEAVGPNVEEGDLRAEILAACRSLGKTEDQLIDWLKKKYQADSIESLTLVERREVLSFLRRKVAQQRAA
ncbi:MAG TPA: hypothetical protein VE842_16775, partial [Pyrinomonadaceae bacterium]|nr:hypothetical protein [Pyrinomonadaceae bacterium]